MVLPMNKVMLMTMAILDSHQRARVVPDAPLEIIQDRHVCCQLFSAILKFCSAAKNLQKAL